MIYLLEDDSGIRELVAYTLTGSVMQTVGFERPSEFRAALDIDFFSFSGYLFQLRISGVWQ